MKFDEAVNVPAVYERKNCHIHFQQYKLKLSIDPGSSPTWQLNYTIKINMRQPSQLETEMKSWTGPRGPSATQCKQHESFSAAVLCDQLVSVGHGWILLGSGKWRVRLGPNIFSFPLFLFSFCLQSISLPRKHDVGSEEFLEECTIMLMQLACRKIKGLNGFGFGVKQIRWQISL